MPDPFLDPIFDRMAREQRAGLRIGTLTAIDTGDASVTVSLAGDSVPGVRWVGSYTPVVGDMVVVSRVDAMWVVLGKMSKQFGAPTVAYGAFSFVPNESRVARLYGGTWTWQLTQPYSDPVWQGAEAAGEGFASIFHYGSLVGSIPDGATVTSAKVTLHRAHPIDGDLGAALVQPVIYGHTGTNYPDDPPVLTAGYGPWRPGWITQDQTATWDLPSAWLTAWLAGTITGLALSSTKLADLAIFTGVNDAVVTVSYTTPA